MSDQHANQKNPHHIHFWRSRGYSEDDAARCARAGRDDGDSLRAQGRRGGPSPDRQQAGRRAQSPAPRRAPSPARRRDPSPARPSSARRGRPDARDCPPVELMPLSHPNQRGVSPGRGRRGGPSHGDVSTIETSIQLPGDSAPRRAVLTMEQKTKVAPMCMSLLIDTSGSMAGGAITNVMDQSIKMLKAMQRLSHTAKASVTHFDTDVKQVIRRLPIKDIKFQQLKETAQKDASAGFQTALYDAIASGLENLKAYHSSNSIPDMHYFLTAFTDGCDNASKTQSLDSVSRMLSHPGLPNFHFFVISAGQEAGRELKHLVAGKAHCRHLVAGSTSNNDLNKVFKEFTSHMEEVLTLKINSRAGSNPAMPQVLNGFRQMKIGGAPAIANVGQTVTVQDVTIAQDNQRGRSQQPSGQGGRRGRSRSRSRR